MFFGIDIGIDNGMNILIQMVSESLGVPAVDVVVQQGLLFTTIALTTSAVNVVAQIYRNSQARKAAKKQQELAERQASFNREQGRQMYGEEGMYRRQTDDALSHAEQRYDRGVEQVAFSWEQAQAAYDESVESLNYQRDRATEGIDRQNLANKASLGAFGVRGGSGRSRANETISNAREDLSFEYGQNMDQMDMQLDQAENQKDWANEELDQSWSQAEESHGYAMEQADMQLAAAEKGYEFSTEAAQLQYDAIESQTNAMSVVTAGLQGLSSGMQFGANLDTFGQKYFGWGQNTMPTYQSFNSNIPGVIH
jgi:hypothetical protein